MQSGPDKSVRMHLTFHQNIRLSLGANLNCSRGGVIFALRINQPEIADIPIQIIGQTPDLGRVAGEHRRHNTGFGGVIGS